MDKSEFETTSFCLSSQPHRHLKSGTYQSLIRILSQCYDHSQVSAPQEPTPGELVAPDGMAKKDAVMDESCEAVGLESKGPGETRMTVDEIQNILEIEENDNLLNQNDLMTSDNADGTGSQHMGFDWQQILMDELENIVKGDGQLVLKNSNIVSAASMGEKQSCLVPLMNDREEHVHVEQVVNDEFEKEGQLQLEKIHCDLRISEPVDSNVDRSVDCQLSKPSENIEDRCSLLRTKALEVVHEMPQKEMALEKLVHSDGTIGSHNCVAEDVEVEEGEISVVFENGEAGVIEGDKVSIDMLFDNALLSEEKKEGKKQESEDVIDKREFTCNTQNAGNKSFSEPTASIVKHANSGRAIEREESVRNDKQCESRTFVHGASMKITDADRYTSVPGAGRNKRKFCENEENIGFPAADLNNPTLHVEILEQSATRVQGITSKDRMDSGVCSKKKRSALSKERKAKKKQKERKKRAEKNRQLGVKRLKLRPVLKPKTVTYCRHYLMGRCQEGDKCKYSHDTIPLTKSKPCCHFARNSCMKGDDCPFDHQLSKYPCNNFVAKGFCNRGDDCMFSHKMLPKEATTSASSDLSNSGIVSLCKNTEPNVAVTLPKPPPQAPKGVSCLFLGKSSVLESSKPKQGSLSPKRSESGEGANQTEQTAVAVFQNKKETSMRTPPAVGSKGVNFLSFGNFPLENSNSEKLSSSLLIRENSVKSSLSNNFNVDKQAGSSHNGEHIAKVGNQTMHTMSSTIENSQEMLKKIHPESTSQGLNFLSMRKALTNESLSNEHSSLPSSSDISINRCCQESQNTHNKQQNSSAIPRRPPGFLLATGHSSNSLALGHCKSTPNSSQKALMSTLAFAAKIETERKINLSALSAGANNQTRDDGTCLGAAAGSSRGLVNDSAKAAKILEFLSVVGKMKQ